MENEEVIFKIILHSGDARSYVMESFQKLRNGQNEEAHKLLEEADKSLNKAHKYQNDIIIKEINGEKIDTSILMMHAQDHFMTSMTMRDMAKEIILMFESQQNK